MIGDLVLESMDFQSNSPSESGKLEQIISQFLLKSLHVILDSRIPSLRPHDHSGDLSTGGSRVKKSDKWFNLVLGDRPAALENLNFWHRNVMDPMIIDIILIHEGPSSSSVDNLYTASTVGTTSVETVIERWVVQYESPRAATPPVGEISASYKRTYKKSIVLLRSLYSQMRLLPAYRIFRQLSSSSQAYNFDIIYKVSSFGDPFTSAEEKLREEYSFPPLEAFPGRLSVFVSYRSTLSDFNLEPSTTMPPKIITDYVGSPATDPLRSFPTSEKGIRATSFPLKGARPPSVPLERPHSWTSGFHRAAPFMQNQPLVRSPPVYRSSPTSSDSPSSPSDMYSNRAQNYRLLSNQKTTSYDEYQLSPPFSPSPSPSPPTYFYSGNPNQVQTRKYPETAPVSIPATMTGRSSRYRSPNFSDPVRNPLPPLSPRSIRNDHSSQESPSGIRSFRRIDSSRAGDMTSGITNHYTSQKVVLDLAVFFYFSYCIIFLKSFGYSILVDNFYILSQVIKDSKDDSGRFSGPLSSSGSPRIGFSRSSSRLSFQDDLDDFGFSCPFDVDDVDPPDFQVRYLNIANFMVINGVTNHCHLNSSI